MSLNCCVSPLESKKRDFWNAISQCEKHKKALRQQSLCSVKRHAPDSLWQEVSLISLIHMSPSIEGLDVDCKGTQLPYAILELLQNQTSSITHLSVKNFPHGCRVCVYEWFRASHFDKFSKLLELTLERKYFDECYIGAKTFELPLSLQKLTFNGVGLVNLPSCLPLLKGLTHLDISNNIVTSISDICLLSTLTHLDVSENILIELPDNIGLLSNLIYLNAGQNNIKKLLPQSMSCLDKLQFLNLEWNRLKVFEQIDLLSSLEVLNISHNKLTAIPQRALQCPRLQVLDVSGNPLNEDANAIVKLSSLSQLQQLNLSDTDLVAIPQWVSQLHQLKKLDIQRNLLTSIRELSSLANLEELSLAQNKLLDDANFYSTIKDLSKLHTLDVADQFTCIPDSSTLSLVRNDIAVDEAMPNRTARTTEKQSTNKIKQKKSLMPNRLTCFTASSE